MFTFDPASEDDADVDREIRIEKMKRELHELAGGAAMTGSFGDLSPKLEETFLALACNFQKATWNTNFSRLAQRGVEITPPTELDEVSLGLKLQELLRALATIGCVLDDTDHLSARELYTWLWAEALREETPNVSELGGRWHRSPIGGCDEHDTAIFLGYYASENERQQWQEEFPNDPLPPHCPLPYNRDRNLPRLDS